MTVSQYVKSFFYLSLSFFFVRSVLPPRMLCCERVGSSWVFLTYDFFCFTICSTKFRIMETDTTIMYSTKFFLPCLVHWFRIKRSAVFANDGYHIFSPVDCFLIWSILLFVYNGKSWKPGTAESKPTVYKRGKFYVCDKCWYQEKCRWKLLYDEQCDVTGNSVLVNCNLRNLAVVNKF